MIGKLYNEERQRLEPRIRERLDAHAQLLKITPDQFLVVLRQTILDTVTSSHGDVVHIHYQLSCVLDRWLSMIRSGASFVIMPDSN